MSVRNDEIINSISKMSVLELVDLIKEIEKTFNISTNNVLLKPNLASDDSKQETKIVEKTMFTVIMTSYGEDKINIIKKVRTILNLGLKEAKDFVETLPATIKKDIPKAEAESIKSDLEVSGAKIDLK
jgi:large subunit ribosomal protein L7/L12